MNSDFCVAIHAMVYLDHKGCALNSQQLAENIGTHPARVRRVLSKLSKSGLLDSTGGSARGGYTFNKDPYKVTLRDVALAVDIRFVGTDWRSGNSGVDCAVASGMGDLMDSIFTKLDVGCYESLGKITIAALESKLVKKSNAEKAKTTERV